MNCLDFRRQLLADPFSKEAELLAHEADCPDCAPFARKERAQEVRLRRALQEISPPEGLAERIQLAARFDQRSTVQRRWWYSAAAGVLMAIGVSMISLFSTSIERGNVALAQSVIHHIEDESHHLREVGPVAEGRLERVFGRFGARLAGDLGTVNFAAECLMRDRTGVHLVLAGERGPITVFFMPGEMTSATLPVSSERFSGEVIPAPWGSIAVVGESGEPLQGLGQRLAASVQWPHADTAGSGLVGGRLVAAAAALLPQQQDG